jgi:hypothetical protein
MFKKRGFDNNNPTTTRIPDFRPSAHPWLGWPVATAVY